MDTTHINLNGVAAFGSFQDTPPPQHRGSQKEQRRHQAWGRLEELRELARFKMVWKWLVRKFCQLLA